MKLKDTIALQLQKDKGVGDTVKRITSAVGIKPCGECEKRAEALNKKFPYRKDK